MRCSRSDGTLIALPECRVRHDMAGAEIVAVGLDHQFAVGGTGRGGNQNDLREVRCGAVERQPRMGHWMRLDRDYFAVAPM